MTEPQPEGTHPLAHRADHLAPHKWKPGQSENPAGRKPRPLLSEELHEVLGEPVDPADLASKSKLRALAEKIVELATSGNVKAAELLSKLARIIHTGPIERGRGWAGVGRDALCTSWT